MVKAKKYITKSEIKQIEKDLKFINSFHIIEAIEHLRQFSVGDIVNFRTPPCDDEGPWQKRYYSYNGCKTEVELKYQVEYIDSKGLPHLYEITNNGEKGEYIDAFEEIEKQIHDDLFCGSLKVSDTLVHDLAFIDAAILQNGNYNPLAEYEEVQKAKAKELEAKVVNYYNLKEHNKKLRLYTGTIDTANKFIKTLNVGDVVYEQHYGEMKIKLKLADIMVFEVYGSAIAMNLQDLRKYTFYLQKPIDIEHIDHATLAKFKPKSK